MNLKQINGGLVGLEYFFFIAIMSGISALITLTALRALERSWTTAREAFTHERRFREETDSVPIQEVVKRLLFDQKEKVRFWWVYQGQYWFRQRPSKEHAA